MVEVLENRWLPSTLTVGPNVNMDKLTGNQNEATLVINPTNMNNLVGFSNDEAASGGVRIYVSNDGGTTWTTRIFGFHSDGETDACCDTQAAFDTFGNLFVTNLESSGPTKILLSTDGGSTFKAIATFSGSNDQPSIATGSGQVWVSYTNSSGVIAADGANVTGLGKVGTFVKETAPKGNGDFGNVSIGPTGQVMVTYMNPTGGAGPATIYGNLDPDGTGSQKMGAKFTITKTNVGGFDPIPAQPQRTVDAEPNLAYDRSGGTHNGRVYLVYTDSTAVGSAALTIYLRYSDNNGSTWSSPVKVNDDTTSNSHFNPQIFVDQATGNVALAWYDCRNAGTADKTAQIFATVSTDGGNTFLPNVLVSAGTSNSGVSGAAIDYGDFMTMEFRNNVFYPVWSDNSNSTGDNPNGHWHGLNIYTAKVTFSANDPLAPAASFLHPAVSANPSPALVTNKALPRGWGGSDIQRAASDAVFVHSTSKPGIAHQTRAAGDIASHVADSEWMAFDAKLAPVWINGLDG
jgi:hypothetical protein